MKYLPAPSDLTIRITTPWCCAGVIVRNDRVYVTAPILKNLRSFTLDQLLNHCRHNRYTCEIIP